MVRPDPPEPKYWKARYDAGAQWQMNFSLIDRAACIPPNVRVRDK